MEGLGRVRYREGSTEQQEGLMLELGKRVDVLKHFFDVLDTLNPRMSSVEVDSILSSALEEQKKKFSIKERLSAEDQLIVLHRLDEIQEDVRAVMRPTKNRANILKPKEKDIFIAEKVGDMRNQRAFLSDLRDEGGPNSEMLAMCLHAKERLMDKKRWVDSYQGDVESILNEVYKIKPDLKGKVSRVEIGVFDIVILVSGQNFIDERNNGEVTYDGFYRKRTPFIFTSDAHTPGRMREVIRHERMHLYIDEVVVDVYLDDFFTGQWSLSKAVQKSGIPADIVDMHTNELMAEIENLIDRMSNNRDLFRILNLIDEDRLRKGDLISCLATYGLHRMDAISIFSEVESEKTGTEINLPQKAKEEIKSFLKNLLTAIYVANEIGLEAVQDLHILAMLLQPSKQQHIFTFLKHRYPSRFSQALKKFEEEYARHKNEPTPVAEGLPLDEESLKIQGELINFISRYTNKKLSIHEAVQAVNEIDTELQKYNKHAGVVRDNQQGYNYDFSGPTNEYFIKFTLQTEEAGPAELIIFKYGKLQYYDIRGYKHNDLGYKLSTRLDRMSDEFTPTPPGKNWWG